MLDHHLQREIHFQLSHADSLRFSELQPEGVENKLFDYHLKKTLRSGLIQKNDDGSYSLTPTGRRIGAGTLSRPSSTADKAYSLLLFGLQREDGAWLLYERTSHPQINRVGLPQHRPDAHHSTLESARTFATQIDIEADFSVHAHGYLRVFDENDAVESFVHFTLLKGVCSAADTPLPDGYRWVAAADFSDLDLLPSTSVLMKLLAGPTGGFADETLRIS